MKLLAPLFCTALTLAIVTAAQAEVPVYRDQQLDLPTGVVLTEDGPVYYGDIRFTANDDGSFTLVEAKPRNLAEVEAASVALNQLEATVTANGVLSIACVALEEPGVVRDGNTFYVVLAETPIDPLALCMPFVAITKFAVDVPLDLSGLEAGEYRVLVNGVETFFSRGEVNL